MSDVLFWISHDDEPEQPDLEEAQRRATEASIAHPGEAVKVFSRKLGDLEPAHPADTAAVFMDGKRIDLTDVPT